MARVTYEPGAHELAASKHHGKILQRVLEEMGAEYVIHTSSPGVSYHGIGATPVPESRHVIGTARMGDNPDTSVCDRWGRVHEWDNVVVADSSVFVTASGYGPTLTLVALAARAAHHLADTKPIGPVGTDASRRRVRLRHRLTTAPRLQPPSDPVGNRGGEG